MTSSLPRKRGSMDGTWGKSDKNRLIYLISYLALVITKNFRPYPHSNTCTSKHALSTGNFVHCRLVKYCKGKEKDLQRVLFRSIVVIFKFAEPVHFIWLRILYKSALAGSDFATLSSIPLKPHLRATGTVPHLHP